MTALLIFAAAFAGIYTNHWLHNKRIERLQKKRDEAYLRYIHSGDTRWCSELDKLSREILSL